MIILYLFLNIIAAICFLFAFSLKDINVEFKRIGFLKNLNFKLVKYIKRFGVNRSDDILIYSIMPFLGAPISIIMIFSGKIGSAFIVLILPIVIEVVMLAGKKKKIRDVFQKNAYKLYKYILNQTAAGVRPSDALKDMHMVVSDKVIKKVLKEACAKYSVTLDNNVLAKDILENIDTPEAKSFSMTVRDRLFETRDHKLMKRLEELMFNRYFVYVQKMTDAVRTRCLFSVILLCSVIVIMVLVPTFIDVQNALNSIFL